MKKLCFFSVFMIFLNMRCMEPVRTLPNDVKIILDDHTEELSLVLDAFNKNPDAKMGINVKQNVPWLSGWLIKYGIERVANRERLQQFIQENKLNKWGVAEKYLYHVPGRSTILSSENYLVIAKAVIGKNCNQALGLEETRQLWKIACDSKHYDLHPANYITTQDGIVIIIDTDKNAMPSSDEIARLEKDWIMHGTRIHDGQGVCMSPEIINDPSIKIELSVYSKWNNYSDEAGSYLSEAIMEREQLRIKTLNEQKKT